jgi:phosphoribosylanthranilate isomerase
MMQPHGQQKAFGSGCYWTAPKMYWCLSARLLAEDEQRRTKLMAGFEYLLDNAPAKTRESMRAQGFQPTFFLDSGTPEKPGGTGTTFDWQLAVPLVDAMKKSVNVVVAGGLTPNNVGKAIAVLKPFGVDVSSGVEAKPGKKDPDKVRAFIRAVREADKVA